MKGGGMTIPHVWRDQFYSNERGTMYGEVINVFMAGNQRLPYYPIDETILTIAKFGQKSDGLARFL